MRSPPPEGPHLAPAAAPGGVPIPFIICFMACAAEDPSLGLRVEPPEYAQGLAPRACAAPSDVLTLQLVGSWSLAA